MQLKKDRWESKVLSKLCRLCKKVGNEIWKWKYFHYEWTFYPSFLCQTLTKMSLNSYSIVTLNQINQSTEVRRSELWNSGIRWSELKKVEVGWVRWSELWSSEVRRTELWNSGVRWSELGNVEVRLVKWSELWEPKSRILSHLTQ